jgi:D-beta-D-heptose 7-phosphate kinase/D-beta-D-heptose 1-phosphate adenosyltransferase
MSLLLTLDDVARAGERYRTAGERVAMTNGCFDVLHAGHLRLIESARAEADRLVVAINSDASVRRLKGPTRPVIPESERAEVLLAMAAVDAVAIYDDETPLRVVEALRPDVLAKGADWPLDQIVGRAEVEAAGGRVVRIPLVEGRSTTAILERIRKP